MELPVTVRFAIVDPPVTLRFATVELEEFRRAVPLTYPSVMALSSSCTAFMCADPMVCPADRFAAVNAAPGKLGNTHHFQ